MALVAKGNPDNPHIPENYYLATFTGITPYSRDADDDAMGAVLQFTISPEDNDNYDGDEVEIPFFAPAKLSISSSRESSRLGEHLQNLGLLEPVLEILGCKDEVLSEKHKWIATNDAEFDDLENALNGVLKGKTIRVNVEDQQEEDASQVSKLSKVFDADESETADSADGGAADL